MSSIQDLIGQIEKNQKKPEKISIQKKKPVLKTNPSEAKKSETKKIVKKSIQKKVTNTKEKSGGKEKGRNKIPNKTPKKKKNTSAKKRFFVTKVCMSKKSCADNSFAPYVWERLCNDYNQDPKCDSFEVQGFRFEKSPQCQGLCKKSANIRIQEENVPTHTQFSYITPIKASKLIKMIKSGASPENIKKL